MTQPDAWSFSVASENTYKFTGKERDSESGLDYFGARHYSSSFGRFIIPDWAAKPVTVPYATLGNPQSLNLYSYVQNNPTVVVDSDGHGDATGGFCDANRCYSTAADDRDNVGVGTIVKQTLGIGALTIGVLGVPEIGSAALVRFAPLLTTAGAGLQRARDEVTESIENLKSFDLSRVTSSRVERALNSLSDHATDMDIKGVVKEANGLMQGNHFGEMEYTVNSLQNIKSSLMGALRNPNLSDDERAAFSKAVQDINKFAQAAKPLIAKAKRAQDVGP
jgi:RHS repeat-associated protein